MQDNLLLYSLHLIEVLGHFLVSLTKETKFNNNQEKQNERECHHALPLKVVHNNNFKAIAMKV